MSPKREDKTVFKVALIGERGVGKSSLIHGHKYGSVPVHICPTITTDFWSVDYDTHTMQLWDCASNQQLRQTIQFCHQATAPLQAVILVFDFSNPDSFTYIEKNYGLIKDVATIVLVGNKHDLSETLDKESNPQLQKKIDSFLHTHTNVKYIPYSAHSPNRDEDPFTYVACQQGALSPFQKEIDSLRNALQAYIKRVQDNYGQGFLLFKHSRSLNRQANCLLAKWFLEQLENSGLKTNEQVRKIFENYEEQRKKLIHDNKLGVGLGNRGVNSTELKGIIQAGASFRKEAPKGISNIC